ncbi:helix-turn-helix transcriptional regulator [Nocardia cyriacigeorgica]|uniref:helix-turn-helix transcriptional regulator n=1 Tax=Nocardia cyriacigeorgica TaxID=135487 RepID=UPI002114206C|nr:YafY family protein [Nocardia cyriacigeorgica]
MSDTTGRMLELLATLQTGRRYSGRDLSARLGVSARTLRRDIDRLRSYGYPVTTQPGPTGYYQLAAGRTLPPLVLDDDEAVATLIALALLGATGTDEPPANAHTDIGAAADRAFGKIDQFLPTRLRLRAEAVRASLEAAPLIAPAVDAELLALLGAAAGAHERVRFDYIDKSGARSTRRVEPYRQVNLHLRWYLLAWDLDRADWRTFRLDRITDAVATGARFTPRPLPAESGIAYLRAGLTARRYRAVAVVDAPAATIRDALKFQDCDIEALGADQSRVVTRVDSFEWLVLQLALTGADFTIEEPVEFRDRCRELGERLLRAAT